MTDARSCIMTTDTNAQPAPPSLLAHLYFALMGVSIIGYAGGISLAVAALYPH